MRNTIALLSLLAILAGARAQTDEVASGTVAPAAQPAPAEALASERAPDSGASEGVQLSDETHIRSESVDLGIKSRTAVYRGNVRLDDPRLRLTCEYLFANIPETGPVDRIIAETNVVITMLDDKGLTNWAYAEKAVYTYQASESVTNEIVELTGSPRLERAEGILYGDTIIWDRARNEIRATNQRMGPRRAEVAPATTNAPADAPPASSDQTPAAMPDAPADE